MQLIPEAGHFPTLEAPEATSDAIQAFLDGPILLR
jgi:pimeloyl-ACP methyl ester carboxylesterase